MVAPLIALRPIVVTTGDLEQSLGIVTVLGGVYRIAERARRSRAIEWAMTSEKVAAATMERFGIVNRVIPYAERLTEARAIAQKVSLGPTRAHAAHKALMAAATS